MKIRRVYVEKMQNADFAAKAMLSDLQENLIIKNLESVRIINVYDIEGLSDEGFEKCKYMVFAEPNLDKLYEEDFPKGDREIYFGTAYLPGQFDQRADSCLQCIQAVTLEEGILVKCSKVYGLSGDITASDIEQIKSYCINPVDSEEVPLVKPESLALQTGTGNTGEGSVFEDFIEKSDTEIVNLRNKLGLAMSAEDLIFCRDYFKNGEKRNPTVTEIKVIDTYWSDHCRHTTFLTSIEEVAFDEGKYKALFEEAYNLYLTHREKVYAGRDKEITLMDMAVMGAKALKAQGLLGNLDESEEINACSIVIEVDSEGKKEDWLLMFKNETHNHPTEIEPFGGAATCLGGAIRDPLAGRAYVYQAMRITGSGDPRTKVSDTIPGKLPQRQITKKAAEGYSSYGNQIGLATGIVREIYHEGYVAKRMELGAVVGAVKKENVKRETPELGDVIILVGGRTGRDGCGGATGSSKEHSEESIHTCGAEVQKGNPPTERKLQRLFRNPKVSEMIKRCNDFGAGGVAVAIGELSEGLEINLDLVPKKYEGLNGTELAISESQERMAVVVSPENAEEFIKEAALENLEATAVALVTDNGRLIMKWQNRQIVDLSRDFLDTNGVRQKTRVRVTQPTESAQPVQGNKAVSNDPSHLLHVLSDLNVASQKGLGEMFDSTIGTGTVLMPFGGKNQLTPIEAMVAKIPAKDTNTASVMAYGFNPYKMEWSPFHGAVYAVVESVCRVAAAGGYYKNIYLTFQEYFEKLGEDPVKWGKPFNALNGAFYAQMKLELAAIGGKDSMSGTFKDINVPPTLVSFAICSENTDNIISPEFKGIGNSIVLLKTKYDENEIPGFETLKLNLELVRKLIGKKVIISANTVGAGGVAAAAAKMCFGNMIGADISCKDLYSPAYGSFVLEFDMEEDAVRELLGSFAGIDYEILGRTVIQEELTVNNTCVKLSDAVSAWMKPLEKVFPTNYFIKGEDDSNIDVKPVQAKNRSKSALSIAKPRVFIPVFPGTNCEDDMRSAFERAGGEGVPLVIKNLSMEDFKESVEKAAEIIGKSQIIALPGGFSAGDEPEGSGKFIAAFFRNPYLKEAVDNFLNNRDGLMLGICNGFQALIKLGLLPYGEITDLPEDAPTLTFNKIGRHVSCLVRTKIVNSHSPWFNGVSAGDEFLIPISHGEGRFFATNECVKSLIDEKQIATQYVDMNLKGSYDMRFNPNGSYYGIEGITSKDGRILGKMGHSERIGNGLYKNVPGEVDQRLFESGIGYFR